MAFSSSFVSFDDDMDDLTDLIFDGDTLVDMSEEEEVIAVEYNGQALIDAASSPMMTQVKEEKLDIESNASSSQSLTESVFESNIVSEYTADFDSAITPLVGIDFAGNAFHFYLTASAVKIEDVLENHIPCSSAQLLMDSPPVPSYLIAPSSTALPIDLTYTPLDDHNYSPLTPPNTPVVSPVVSLRKKRVSDARRRAMVNKSLRKFRQKEKKIEAEEKAEEVVLDMEFEETKRMVLAIDAKYSFATFVPPLMSLQLQEIMAAPKRTRRPNSTNEEEKRQRKKEKNNNSQRKVTLLKKHHRQVRREKNAFLKQQIEYLKNWIENYNQMMTVASSMNESSINFDDLDATLAEITSNLDLENVLGGFHFLQAV